MKIDKPIDVNHVFLCLCIIIFMLGFASFVLFIWLNDYIIISSEALNKLCIERFGENTTFSKLEIDTDKIICKPLHNKIPERDKVGAIILIN